MKKALRDVLLGSRPSEVVDAGDAARPERSNDDVEKKAKASPSTTDVDVGVVEVVAEPVPLPPGMDRRLLLKADLFVTVFMAFLYSIQFADKTMSSGAAILGLRQDLDMMHGSGYSWVGSSFYLGYLVFEFPMSYVLLKFPLAKATAIIIVCWGAIIACSAACQNMESFLTTRTLLGAFESAVTPAFVILTAQWYKRHEHFSRTLLWFAANGVGTILASSIAYGLLVRQDNHDLAIPGWKILYIIMGLITVVFGALFFFHMPDTPQQAWFLTAEEKRWHAERVRENQQDLENHEIKWYQVREAFIDPMTWLFFGTVIASNVPNGGVTNFMNLILEGMNYTPKQSLLMGLPGGGVEFVGLTATAMLSSYIGKNRRMAWACSAAAVSLMCLCLVAWGPNNGAQLSGLYIYNAASPIAYVGLISCVESNSAGHTKKLTTNALFLIGYCVGNLIGPQTFLSSQAPTYSTGKTAMATTSAIQLGLQCCVVVMYLWRNWRRDRKDERLPPGVDPETADLTDFENPEFRYAL